MGFLSSSCSFTRFTIADPVPDELWEEIPERLHKGAFLDIDDIPEVQSRGWVCFDDYLDNEWKTSSPHKGEFIAFSLRLDTRRIPAGVIRKHLALALKKEKAANEEAGKKFISRERKKELKEQVVLRLRQRFLPVPAEFNVIWNRMNNEIWFASTQRKMIELFQTTFFDTFDLHLQPLTPSELAISILGEEHVDDVTSVESTIFSV